MGWVTVLVLLCLAQPFQPAPDLYRAKPQDVPSWAEQGNFRFIRLNDGQMAERTEHLLEIAVVDMRLHRPEKTIVIDLHDERYNQLVVEWTLRRRSS